MPGALRSFRSGCGAWHPVDSALFIGWLAPGHSTLKFARQATRLRQHVLVVFVAPDAPLAHDWFKLRLEDRTIRPNLTKYQILEVSLKSDGDDELAEHLGVDLQEEMLPFWRFGDGSNKQLAAMPVPRSADDSKASEKENAEEKVLDRAAINELLVRYAPEPLDARQLMEDAFSEAKKSNRRVLSKRPRRGVVRVTSWPVFWRNIDRNGNRTTFGSRRMSDGMGQKR